MTWEKYKVVMYGDPLLLKDGVEIVLHRSLNETK